MLSSWRGALRGDASRTMRFRKTFSLWIGRPAFAGALAPLAACFTSVLRRPGGFGGEPVPDPIPNSAVKLPCADGTKS